MSCECPTWGERIDHVLDGELSPEEEALFRGHLAGCDTCRRELEQERQLRESLAALPELPCPPRVAQRIEAATGVASQPGFAPAQGQRSGRWSAVSPRRQPCQGEDGLHGHGRARRADVHC